jgi:hypothetical protein
MPPSPEEWSDAAHTADRAAGQPLPVTPEQGLLDMRARITFLTERLALARERDDHDAESVISMDLHEARHRLKEYEAQLQGRN